MANEIIFKIKKAGLVGRGGACFSVAEKWQLVKKAEGQVKYVICNASEGEPDVKKDKFILEKYPREVITGIMAAVEYIGAKKAYIYLNQAYYKEIGSKLEALIGSQPIEVLEKPHTAGYIGGEESAAINAIEGKRIEPRLRPPYPVDHGLFGAPTLTNNVETFYDVARVIEDNYKPTRFFTVAFHGPKSFRLLPSLSFIKKDVFSYPADWSIEKILKKSGTRPSFKFFVQVGGRASGVVLNSNQLNEPPHGSGSITIYDLKKHNPASLINYWMNFFQNESCGKCVPCREGTYRISEQLKKDKANWELIRDLLVNLTDSAFCGLGCAVPIAITSYFKNVYPIVAGETRGFESEASQAICDCFK